MRNYNVPRDTATSWVSCCRGIVAGSRPDTPYGAGSPKLRICRGQQHRGLESKGDAKGNAKGNLLSYLCKVSLSYY